MILRFHFSLLVAAVALLLNGCSPDISGRNDQPAEKGSADFSTFVAIGDSLTAGYADSALYRDGQLNSFPAIMAQQFALAGGGAFTQPEMLPEKTGSLFFGAVDLMRSDRLVLVATGDPGSPATPAQITPSVPSNIATESMPGLYNNLGVPGAKIFHGPFVGYGNPAGLVAVPPTANPYYVRFANDPVTSSMLLDALAQSPSFFSLWLGNNDLLLYATDGADPTVSGESVTPIGVMTASFDALLGALKTVNNKGLLINVPDVSTIPYFNTIPYDAIPLSAAQADQLNMDPNVIGYNAGVTASIGFNGLTAEEAAARQISYQEGQNRILILDEDLTDLTGVPGTGGALIDLRQTTANDFVVLPASSKLGTEQVPGNPATVWGVSNPMLDADVLTEVEIRDELEPVRLAFNDHVKAAADADSELVFFDADALLRELNETGILYGSGGISSTFAQGGGFSLDGIHPTARGYAVIANEIFKLINEDFDAYIPPVDPSDYTTVFYH